MRAKYVFSLLIGLSFLLIACKKETYKIEKIGMANPAAVHCAEKGGELHILKNKDGSESGYCQLPNGSICEEWALFRGEGCVKPPEGATFKR